MITSVREAVANHWFFRKYEMLSFIVRNDYESIHILDADFVIAEDGLYVADELPEEVINAIIVLRNYATKVEATVV